MYKRSVPVRALIRFSIFLGLLPCPPQGPLLDSVSVIISVQSVLLTTEPEIILVTTLENLSTVRLGADVIIIFFVRIGRVLHV